MKDLFLRDPAGHYIFKNPITEANILEIATDIVFKKVKAERQFQGSNDVKQYLKLKLGKAEREIFAVLFLDNHHRLQAYEELFFGTVNACNVYPREVIKRAIFHNTACVVLAHNHPSGVAEPSEADIQLTKTLKESLQVLDIRVLDHLIVGESDVQSMSELGLI